jgi:hypothetical protein
MIPEIQIAQSELQIMVSKIQFTNMNYSLFSRKYMSYHF